MLFLAIGLAVATVFVLAHLLEEALNKTLFDAFVATDHSLLDCLVAADHAILNRFVTFGHRLCSLACLKFVLCHNLSLLVCVVIVLSTVQKYGENLDQIGLLFLFSSPFCAILKSDVTFGRKSFIFVPVIKHPNTMNEQKIDYLQWRNHLSDFTSANMRIGTDIMLIREGFDDLKDRPFKADVTTCIIYLQGSVRFRLNMKEFHAQAPCFVILPCDTIIETIYTSEDAISRIVVMSREFTDSLFSAQQRTFHLLMDVIANPVINLATEETAIISYYSMLKNLVCRSNTPYRLEAARHLTLALFYSFTSLKHSNNPTAGKRDRKDEIYDQFIELLQQNYKRERELSFYADRMCITTKYLSKAVKDATGRSASDWIEEYVVTESKALLYSTNQTIQQIATELHFESQSLFGKYFKRVTGISPRQYRSGIIASNTSD